jgi:hypothetical protein
VGGHGQAQEGQQTQARPEPQPPLCRILAAQLKERLA